MTPITVTDALQMLADCFEADVSELQPDTPRDALPGWDSMGALSLMAELDDRFNLQLTADESRDMLRVSDALDYLRARGALVG